MTYIIVTEPSLKPDIQFAFDFLRQQKMKPKIRRTDTLPIGARKDQRGHLLYVVIRPLSRDEVEYFKQSSNQRYNIMEL